MSDPNIGVEQTLGKLCLKGKPKAALLTPGVGHAELTDTIDSVNVIP